MPTKLGLKLWFMSRIQKLLLSTKSYFHALQDALNNSLMAYSDFDILSLKCHAIFKLVSNTRVDRLRNCGDSTRSIGVIAV